MPNERVPWPSLRMVCLCPMLLILRVRIAIKNLIITLLELAISSITKIEAARKERANDHT